MPLKCAKPNSRKRKLTRKELATQIFQTAYLRGEFKLRSGQISNEYFDKYRFESDPLILDEIARNLAPLVPKGTQLLAGLEMGGIPIATALSLRTGIPVIFVRKSAKDYGTMKFAEGADAIGKNICVIEDVITTGGQVIESTADLRSLNAKVENVLCVIDREQSGEKKLADAGLKLQSLFKMSELKSV